MKQIKFLLVGLALTGCTTFKTSDELVANPKTVSYTLNAPMNYQKTFRTLAEVTRACLQGAAPGNERRTEENVDTTNQIGEIRYINHNLFWGDDLFGYYVIKPVASEKSTEKSTVTVYHPKSALGFWDDQKVVQSWIDGSKKCPL